jgi:hypothetical protein
MKTSISSIKNSLHSLPLFFLLTSCNKADFFQKENLNNPLQTGPETSIPVDDSTLDVPGNNDTPGNNPGAGSTGPNDVINQTECLEGIDPSIVGMSSDPNCAYETFHQISESSKQLDIVWIIDNSGSMADEQNALGLNFNAFIDEFIMRNIDFKMAITTTDTSSFEKKGKMVTGSDVELTSFKARQDENKFKDDFRRLVNVGISGSGREKGLEASEGFMQKYATDFLRPKAYLALVILTDEEDQSPEAVLKYTDYLKTFKDEDGLVKIYTIADIRGTNQGRNLTIGAQRYIEASLATAGVVSDIRSDFHQTLSGMGSSLIELLDSFALTHDPVIGSLRVFVNGNETTQFHFNAELRSIKFESANLPPVGSEIKVYYIKK